MRILARHPQVKLTALTSRSYAGKKYSAVFPSFTGVVDLECVGKDDVDALANDCDVLFIALPHGLAAQHVRKDLLDRVRVIDLGADFRLKDAQSYKHWYESEHHATAELLSEAVYGLTEWRRDEIRNARLVANPGCYATCTLLCLLPLAAAGVLSTERAPIVDAKSGVSGAGRSLSLTTHFNESNETLKAYKVASHRHIPEIEQELNSHKAAYPPITFTPHLIPINRGILATTYCELNESLSNKELAKLFIDRYGGEPFVKVLDDFPETRWVKGSNSCHIGATIDARNKRAIVIGVLDNLVKGAAGQAVQNMNVMFGLEETLGLDHIPLFP